MNRMDDEFTDILGLMTLEELVHLIKELRHSGAVSELLHLKVVCTVSRVPGSRRLKSHPDGGGPVNALTCSYRRASHTQRSSVCHPTDG